MDFLVTAVTREDVGDYVNTLALVYLVLIFIRIILSWIPRILQPLPRGLPEVRDRRTDPYLNLFRASCRRCGMGPGALDLSPIVATFVLIIVSSLVANAIRGEVSGPAAAAATAGLVVALDQATKQLAATNIARATTRSP